jgi:hypothetical protein
MAVSVMCIVSVMLNVSAKLEADYLTYLWNAEMSACVMKANPLNVLNVWKWY